MQLRCTALPLPRARRSLRDPRKERWSLKLTRHNGRAGKHGTYNPKHNDRSFEIANSEHERWCLDNLEKPLAASTFIHHLKDNQKSLGIVYDDKCIGTNRGFHNVDVDLFLPVDVPSPWD